MKNVIIRTDKLCKNFQLNSRNQTVLNNLNINIYEGDFTVIMGSSGAGKSTLLYALSGMDQASSGSVNFFDEQIASFNNDKLAVFRRENCGFVFQQMLLLENMSILDNILACGLLVSKNKTEIIKYAKELLKKVDLTEESLKKFPSQLSGGENQRAAIVRALINKPKVVFADEPTGALNSASGKAVLEVLTEVNNNGQNVIMVTHDIKSAIRGNRILYIKDGIIYGECELGNYQENSKERLNKLNAFLSEMGW